MRLLILLGWAWACLGTDGLDVKKVGEKVVLKPQGDVSSPFNIVWKYGNDIAADYFGSGTTYYDPFKERGYLNTTTGEFTIRNVALTDTNTYTPEINNIIQEGIKLKVYLPLVITPKITRGANTFTCTGDISGVEEISYSWSFPGRTFPNSSQIFEENCLEGLRCTMRNPVSEMKSLPYKCYNPVIIIITVVVLFALAGAVVGHKVKTKEWFWQKGGKFWKSDFWKDTTTQPPPGNGTSPDEGKPMNANP